jgi:DNA uptake protein ComE-like DNA-binding protein
MIRRTWVISAVLAAGLGAAACGSAGQSSPQPGAAAPGAASGSAAGQSGTTPPAATTPPGTQAVAGGATAAAPAAAQAASTKLNLNTATREQFMTVPGVGDRMVREFMEYRPYTSIQQFRREIGKYVSQDQVAAYEQYVYVPIVANSAAAATLRQLPGVDGTIAAQLIAGRPYASTEAFLTRLSQYVTAAQVAAARSYVAAA